jgi:hypothetical protein
MIAPRYILGSFGLILRPIVAKRTLVDCSELPSEHMKFSVHLCSFLDIALIHLFVQTLPIRLEISTSNEAPIDCL